MHYPFFMRLFQIPQGYSVFSPSYSGSSASLALLLFFKGRNTLKVGRILSEVR